MHLTGLPDIICTHVWKYKQFVFPGDVNDVDSALILRDYVIQSHVTLIVN